MENPFEIIEIRLNKIECLLERIIEHQYKPDNFTKQGQWFNMNELCNYHPHRPTKQTVYSWVSKRMIPYYKDKRKLRFLKAEIDDWLKNGKIESESKYAFNPNQLLIQKPNKHPP